MSTFPLSADETREVMAAAGQPEDNESGYEQCARRYGTDAANALAAIFARLDEPIYDSVEYWQAAYAKAIAKGQHWNADTARQMMAIREGERRAAMTQDARDAEDAAADATWDLQHGAGCPACEGERRAVEYRTRTHEDGSCHLAVYIGEEYFGCIAQAPDAEGKFHAVRASQRTDRPTRCDTYTGAWDDVTRYALAESAESSRRDAEVCVCGRCASEHGATANHPFMRSRFNDDPPASLNDLPVLSYQNSVNPAATLGIPASHFDAAHYRIRWYESFSQRGSFTVMRAYCPIGTVTEQPDGRYRASRNGAAYDYPTFGEAVADLMVRTS